MEVFYWRGKREVDFVVAKNFSPIALIQVTYAMGEREVEAIVEAKPELKVDNAVIITWDYEGEVKGVKAVPMWKWLPGEEKLV